MTLVINKVLKQQKSIFRHSYKLFEGLYHVLLALYKISSYIMLLQQFLVLHLIQDHIIIMIYFVLAKINDVMLRRQFSG